MSEDYMTGQQLRDDVFCPAAKTVPSHFVVAYRALLPDTQAAWDAFAARVKMPRPKPPPSLWDVFAKWERYTRDHQNDEEVADLLSRLTAAKAAIDEWNATHGKDAK